MTRAIARFEHHFWCQAALKAEQLENLDMHPKFHAKRVVI
jgi:hypothetical protein